MGRAWVEHKPNCIKYTITVNNADKEEKKANMNFWHRCVCKSMFEIQV